MNTDVSEMVKSNQQAISVVEVSQDRWQDAWSVIKECSEWLEAQGMTHWKDYYTAGVVKDKFKHGRMFVAYCDDEPVGTGSFSFEAPEYYSDEDIAKFADPDAKAVYMSALCVSPRFQKRGIGRKLVEAREEVIAADPTIGAVRFDARASYKELIQFHKRNGFEIVGEQDDEGEIYYLFEKVINR